MSWLIEDFTFHIRPKEVRPMRTLLQNRITRMYFAGSSEWTGDSNEAFDFHNTEVAAEFVQEETLESDLMDIVIIFDNSRYNAVIPAADRLPPRIFEASLFSR